jgi:hypothetical protein
MVHIFFSGRYQTPSIYAPLTKQEAKLQQFSCKTDFHQRSLAKSYLCRNFFEAVQQTCFFLYNDTAVWWRIRTVPQCRIHMRQQLSEQSWETLERLERMCLIRDGRNEHVAPLCLMRQNSNRKGKRLCSLSAGWPWSNRRPRPVIICTITEEAFYPFAERMILGNQSTPNRNLYGNLY